MVQLLRISVECVEFYLYILVAPMSKVIYPGEKPEFGANIAQ